MANVDDAGDLMKLISHIEIKDLQDHGTAIAPTCNLKHMLAVATLISIIAPYSHVQRAQIDTRLLTLRLIYLHSLCLHLRLA